MGELKLGAPQASRVHDAPARVRTTPTVKLVLQRIAKKTMNNQAITECTRSKVKQATVKNQYLNKASNILENIKPLTNRTRSCSTTPPTQALLVAALAASASFNAEYVDKKQLSGNHFLKSALEAAMAVMCADTGTIMKYQELITHVDPILRGKWSTSSAN